MFNTSPKSWRSFTVFSFLRVCGSELTQRRSAATQRYLMLGICVALLFAACPRLSYAQSVVTTVAVGTNPGPMALNPVTNRIYVENY